MIINQFEEATLRLHIPFAEFGDRDGQQARCRIAECEMELHGTGINLEYSHEHKTQEELVNWLSYNDLNVFNCIPTHGRGISSSIDYALSARRPIGVSNSEMYRHLPREVCMDNTGLHELIAIGIEPLKQVYEANSPENLIEALKQKIGL